MVTCVLQRGHSLTVCLRIRSSCHKKQSWSTHIILQYGIYGDMCSAKWALANSVSPNWSAYVVAILPNWSPYVFAILPNWSHYVVTLLPNWSPYIFAILLNLVTLRSDFPAPCDVVRYCGKTFTETYAYATVFSNTRSSTPACNAGMFCDITHIPL